MIDWTGFTMEPNASLLLGWLGRAIFFGTALAALTWAILLVTRGRGRPTFEMALWTIVLAKFLIPAGPTCSVSLANVFTSIWPPPAEVVTSSPFAETFFGFPAEAGPPLVDPSRTGASWRGSDWPRFLAGFYMAMVVLLALARLAGYFSFRRRCLKLPEADEAKQALVTTVCRRLGVRRLPRIRISDEARAPFVMGLLYPLLVLSRSQFVRPNELETVVVHEVTHLRRGDLLVRCIQSVAGVLLFFWPVVVWVNRRIDRAREEACDEWALRHGKLTAGEYARCLLRAVESVRPIRLGYHPACMAGNAKTLERRIDMILSVSEHRSRGPFLRLFVVVFLLAWGAFALTGAAQDKPSKAPKQGQYADTAPDRDRHAQVVFARVQQFGTGDINGDGEITKEECWAFMTAALLAMPEKVIEAYPKADHDGDGKLGKEEAFFFARGDYDFQQLHKKMQPSITKAKESGDKTQAMKLKELLTTKEMAAWHVILDRRSALLEMVEQPPDIEAVRQAAAEIARIGEHQQQLMFAAPLEEIAQLKQKAAQLRADAAKLQGHEAEGRLKKAQHLEQQAEELKAKVVAKLKDDIAKSEAAGKAEEAAKLREMLAKLQEL